jgi:riboflavin kinase/FMN adenylyltransferase
MQTLKIKPHQKFNKISGAVITIGGFDGVHRGHQKIFQTGIALAKKTQKPFGVITFSPIPPMLIYKYFHFILTTEQEKIIILRNLPIDFLGIIKFTSHIKNLEARQFIIDYVIETIKPSAIVVGEDHHFGKGQQGNIPLLQKMGGEFGYELKIVNAMKYHNAPIKSTRIRELIILGNVKRANELLDRPYSITGMVIKGKGLAKKLGFPTLNIHMPQKEKLVPADGVYHIRATFQGKKYDGVMNIGFAPTIAESFTAEITESAEKRKISDSSATSVVNSFAKFRAYQMRSLEVHLFNFSGTEQTALGKEITIEFYDYLRPEKRFDSFEELKNQIAEDIKKVKGLVK